VTTPALDLFDDGDLSGPAAETVRRIAVTGFRALWSGRTVTLAELVDGDAAVVTEAADHLRARGRIELSDDGHVLAVHGLARRPTRHRIEHDGGVVNAWCALDAIGIPAALAIDARAVTQCPTCGRELVVTLTHGAPQALPGAVLWYAEVRCGHLIDDFCSGANLFCSIDHLDSPQAPARNFGRYSPSRLLRPRAGAGAMSRGDQRSSVGPCFFDEAAQRGLSVFSCASRYRSAEARARAARRAISM
jgi:hypothetical protein